MKNNDGIDISKRQLVLGGVTAAVTLTGLSSLILLPDFRQNVLDSASKWNDVAQGVLFSNERLAPIYTENDISKNFPYNGFYPEAYAPVINVDSWALELNGLIKNKTALPLSQLRKMQQESQITRLICIEGWSAVGQWSGVPLHHILKFVGADLSAQFVRFDCADGYHTSIDMASAMHPQTILALDFIDRPLSQSFGAPARLRIPTKLGFKNAKFITHMSVHNHSQGGYWEDQGYNGFSGL